MLIGAQQRGGIRELSLHASMNMFLTHEVHQRLSQGRHGLVDFLSPSSGKSAQQIIHCETGFNGAGVGSGGSTGGRGA
jgi:hypothetical protein